MEAASQGCCGYGFIFDPSQDFCCVASAWGYQKKQCVLSANANSSRRFARGHAPPAPRPEGWKLPKDGCTGISPDGLGCVNGQTYNMTTQAPCGNFVLNLTAGEKCCPNGVRWNQNNETCCFEPSHKPNTYVVVPRPNACSAQ